MLGIPSKESIKKELKNYDEEIINFGLNASKMMNKFHHEEREAANAKEMHTNLRFILEEDKNVNNFIEKHMSMYEHIERDNKEPFSQDIIQYAKMVPLQLLMIGRRPSLTLPSSSASGGFY